MPGLGAQGLFLFFNAILIHLIDHMFMSVMLLMLFAHHADPPDPAPPFARAPQVFPGRSHGRWPCPDPEINIAIAIYVPL